MFGHITGTLGHLKWMSVQSRLLTRLMSILSEFLSDSRLCLDTSVELHKHFGHLEI